VSYIEAMERAGAAVKDSEYFGSYQGEILAHVEYDGLDGFVAVSYGSCSGCDWYEAEVPYQRGCYEHRYDERPDTCDDCARVQANIDSIIVKIGESILDGIMSADAMIAELSKRAEWDSEARGMIAWVQARA